MQIGKTQLPGKPSWSYDQNGLYRWTGTGEARELQEVINWCPTVLRYIVTKDSRAKITSARYTVDVGGHQDTIHADELRDGSGWDRFPGAVGHYDRQVKDALAIVVGFQASQLPQTVATPYWDGDRLTMAESDLMPDGYGTRAGADLAEIVPVCVENPRLALVLGLAYGAPYVEPLGRQPFWVHLTGDARGGKSSGLNLAASLWGRPWPRGVIVPWNTTGNGIPALLGELSVLPAFVDDLHAAGFSPLQIQKLIFSTVEGNSRLAMTRTGRRRAATPWYGVLFSTGNDSILGQLPKPEVAARVVEIPSPLTRDKEASDLVKNWARANYGTWRPVARATMRAALDQAEALLRGNIDGGTEETIMGNLALGVAGAYLVGGRDLASAALKAAREILAGLAIELAESGVKSGDKLLEAVRQYLVTRPGAFPTRQEYGVALAATDRPAPAVQGFWEPPVAYIITSHMDSIGAAYGVPNARVALRDLRTRDEPRLLTEAGANQLRRRIRVPGLSRVDTYAIILDDPDPTPNSPGDEKMTRDTRDTRDSPGQEAWNLSLVPGGQPGTRDNVPAQVGTAPDPQTRDKGRPLRAVSESAEAEDAEEWTQFSQVITSKWPDATPEDVARALHVFRVSLGGLRHIGTSAIAGQLLFHKLQGQHGSIPELHAGGLEGLEEMTVARTFNFVNSDMDVSMYPWVMGLDVNAQFLAVTRSIELGTGHAERLEDLRLPDLRHAKEHLRHPGYVQLSEPHRIAGTVLDAGSWVAHPVAQYLADKGHLVVEPVAYVWWEHRRWLQAWGKTVGTARDRLLQRHDLPGLYALHALKLMYSAFLGGYLRSQDYNRAHTRRPDWSDMLVSLARMNMLRALDKTSPRAFATHADMAYFLLQDNQQVQGLQLSGQAGKWKVGKVGRACAEVTITRGDTEVTTTLAEQVAAGSVGGVRDVVTSLDALRRAEVAA